MAFVTSRMRRVARRGVVPAALLLVAAAPASGEDRRPFMLGASCLTCHAGDSPDGAGIPVIVGRPAAEIAQALMGFRDGTRAGTVMPRLARGYDDAEIALIARWIAARWPGERR